MSTTTAPPVVQLATDLEAARARIADVTGWTPDRMAVNAAGYGIPIASPDVARCCAYGAAALVTLDRTTLDAVQLEAGGETYLDALDDGSSATARRLRAVVTALAAARACGCQLASADPVVAVVHVNDEHGHTAALDLYTTALEELNR